MLQPEVPLYCLAIIATKLISFSSEHFLAGAEVSPAILQTHLEYAMVVLRQNTVQIAVGDNASQPLELTLLGEVGQGNGGYWRCCFIITTTTTTRWWMHSDDSGGSSYCMWCGAVFINYLFLKCDVKF